MPQSQQDLHQQVKTQSLAARERIVELLSTVDGARLHEHPEPGGWSVGEVLEHLCISDELIDGPIRKLIASARRDAGAPAREWKPSFLGKLVAGMLEKPRKMSAPKKFRPGPTPRSGVLAAFVRGDHSILELMDQAASVDWRAARIGSPAFPSFAPKFNLGDVFRVHPIHTARHANQIERLVRQL